LDFDSFSHLVYFNSIPYSSYCHLHHRGTTSEIFSAINYTDRRCISSNAPLLYGTLYKQSDTLLNTTRR
jgi:hypothetical protein